MVSKRKGRRNLLVSIVDDDDSLRTSIRRLIQSFGFKALTFESARQFLTSKHAHSSECLILDVDMPDINGFELAEQLLSGSRKFHIILQSGNTTEADFQRAKALGVALLQKPVDAETLLRTLNRLCRLIREQ